LDFFELAGNVGSVAIQHGAVSVADHTRVVHDDNLGDEVFDLFGRIVSGVGGNVSSLDVLDRDVLDVESDIVSWDGLSQLFVMHFNRLTFSGDINGGEGDVHTGLQDTGFDSSDGDSSDTSDLVDIL